MPPQVEFARVSVFYFQLWEVASLFCTSLKSNKFLQLREFVCFPVRSIAAIWSLANRLVVAKICSSNSFPCTHYNKLQLLFLYANLSINILFIISVVDSLLDKANMTDDFEYFSLIGRGGSCTPRTRTPERDSTQHTPSQHRRVMSTKHKNSSKEAVHRVRSDTKDSADVEHTGAIRQRTNSMPSSKTQLLRVRNFQTSGKRLQNRGDTVKSSSHCSLASGSSGSSEHHSDTEQEAASSAEAHTSSSTHRILLMGAEGVGKTALTQQFLTSDDISADDYLGEFFILSP